MAEKDAETDKLELSLFRRKRKKDTSSAAPEPGTTTSVPESPAASTPTAETASAAPAEPSPAAPTPAARTEPSTTGTEAGPASTTTDDTRTLAPAAPAAPPTTPGKRAARGSRVARKPRRERTRPTLPSAPTLPTMAPGLAALVVGAAVGLAAVVLTFGSLQFCELLTSTDSCGGPGLVVLLVVIVLMILGGSAALRMLGVPEPGGLSFLGVAMFVAVCLVALLPNLLEVWMIAVAPVLCALTFWVAHWIVTRFDEDILTEDGPPPHDVR